MSFVVVRHGESLWNKENKFTGWKDVELSDKGREEARSQSRERTASQGPMPKNLLNRYLEIVGGK